MSWTASEDAARQFRGRVRVQCWDARSAQKFIRSNLNAKIQQASMKLAQWEICNASQAGTRVPLSATMRLGVTATVLR